MRKGGCGSAVFLDIFGAPGKYQNRPFGPVAPCPEAQAHPVSRLHPMARGSRRTARQIVVQWRGA